MPTKKASRTQQLCRVVRSSNGRIFFEDGFGNVDRYGYADMSEQERHLALEMSYVETDRITKQAAFPPGKLPDPSSVLIQEARGTREMITSDQLPAKMPQDDLKKMGIEILGPSQGDPLFVDVKLPQGWKKVPCREDSRTTHLVDADGNRRAYMWYKAASYDRAAYGGVRRRFGIQVRNFNDYTVGVAWVTDERDPGKSRPIFQTKDHKYADTQEGLKDESQQALRDECVAWLDQHYPDWKDCTAYWNVEEPPTVGRIPPWSQKTR